MKEKVALKNKFIPGYLKILEGKISTKLPNAGLRAKPHIESRLRTLKREFQVIHEMLTGPNTSGFGWDTMRKCVTVENDVWEAYVQVKVHHLIDPCILSLLV